MKDTPQHRHTTTNAMEMFRKMRERKRKKNTIMKLNTHMIVTDKDAAAGTEKMMAAGER